MRLEKHHETEYGMPSTHALGGLLPFSMLLALRRHGVLVSWIWWLFAVIYLLSVCVSRLYLGVHSLLDIGSSVVLGVPVLLLLHSAGSPLEDAVFFKPHSIFLHVLMVLLFVCAVPRAAPWTASLGTSSQIFGLFVGFASSLWYAKTCSPQLWHTLEDSSFSNWNQSNGGRVMARVLLGFTLVLAVMVLCKRVVAALLKTLLRAGLLVEEDKYKRDVTGASVPVDKLYCIECTTR